MKKILFVLAMLALVSCRKEVHVDEKGRFIYVTKCIKSRLQTNYIPIYNGASFFLLMPQTVVVCTESIKVKKYIK